MTEIDTCPICLSEYTTAEIHRPASLKCGHLFGYECIIRWFKDSRTNVCPNCSKPCKKSDIRIIFGRSVKCLDSTKEHELTAKYLEEKHIKDKVIHENEQLKLMVNLLQSEISKLEKRILDATILDCNGMSDIGEYSIERVIELEVRYSILAIDKANENIFITYKRNKTLGYLKMLCNSEKFEFVPIFNIMPDHMFITELKISKFYDSLLLICYEKTVALVNSITDNIIVQITCKSKVRSASFGNTKDVLYLGDEKGEFYVYNLRELQFTQIVKLDKIINSIELIDQRVFVSCISNVYKLSFGEDGINSERVEKNNMCKCIYISGDQNYLFMTTREGMQKTTHTIYEYNHAEDNLNMVKTMKNLKQFAKYRNKLYKGKIFYIDEVENSIYILFINIRERHVLYKGKGKIIDFDVSENSIAVLETNSFILLKEKI